MRTLSARLILTRSSSQGVIAPIDCGVSRQCSSSCGIAFGEGKVVAAICHAGWVLVSAGVLKGKKATCVSAIKDDVVNAGASYLDQEVVRDGNLITSRTPDDLPAFCREIIAALGGR